MVLNLFKLTIYEGLFKLTIVFIKFLIRKFCSILTKLMMAEGETIVNFKKTIKMLVIGDGAVGKVCYIVETWNEIYGN